MADEQETKERRETLGEVKISKLDASTRKLYDAYASTDKKDMRNRRAAKDKVREVFRSKLKRKKEEYLDFQVSDDALQVFVIHGRQPKRSSVKDLSDLFR